MSNKVEETAAKIKNKEIRRGAFLWGLTKAKAEQGSQTNNVIQNKIS